MHLVTAVACGVTNNYSSYIVGGSKSPSISCRNGLCSDYERTRFTALLTHANDVLALINHIAESFYSLSISVSARIGALPEGRGPVSTTLLNSVNWLNSPSWARKAYNGTGSPFPHSKSVRTFIYSPLENSLKQTPRYFFFFFFFSKRGLYTQVPKHHGYHRP